MISAIVSVRDFAYSLVLSYIYFHLTTHLLRLILGGGFGAFSLGWVAGCDIIGRYFFVSPKSLDLPRQEPP